MERKRRNIPEKERQAIFKAWDYKCAYCESAPSEVVDHIFPFSKGGLCELENFAASCTRCNSKKTNHELPAGYLAIITAIAQNKAGKIRKELEKDNKPKAIKKPAKKEYYLCICASSYMDWTDEVTELLNKFTYDNKEHFIFTEKQMNTDLLYAFSVIYKGPKGFMINPLEGWDTYTKTEETTAKIKSDHMYILRYLASYKPKKNERIYLDQHGLENLTITRA
jgi:hypothetical protein